MKTIDLAGFPDIFRGCASPGQRMSPELLECFNTSPKTLLRAQCSSGVRLQFSTDSEQFNFSLVFGEPVRQVFTTDIIVSKTGILTCDGPGPHRIALPPGMKEITIHLPHLASIREIELKISDGSSFNTWPDTRKRLLCCGDSILQGMVTSSPAKAPVALTADALDLDFLNTSVGGAGMNPEHVWLTAKLGGDLLLLALGINDAIRKTPFEIFQRNTEESMKILSVFPGRSYVVLPIPNLAPTTPDLDQYRAIIRESAAHNPEIKVLDGYEFFPARPELYSDRTHPNDAGAKIYADFLTQTIQQGGLL